MTENSCIKSASGTDEHRDHSTISPDLIQCTPAAARDWHKEMLMGLFLRSSENDLFVLSNQLPARNKDKYEPGHSISCIGQKRPRDQQIKTFIPDPLSRASDCNLLHILPHILSKTKKMSYESSKGYEDQAEVRKWRRRSFLSKTLDEVKEKSVEDFKKKLKSHAAKSQSTEQETCGLAGSFSPAVNFRMKDTSSDNYKAIALQYNECSVASITKWAAKNMAIKTVEEEKDKTNTCKTFSRPAPAPLYRRCSICNNWGHYEIECTELRGKNMKKLASLLRIQRTLRDFVEEKTILSSEKNRLNDMSDISPITRLSNEEPTKSISESFGSKISAVDEKSDGNSISSNGTSLDSSNNLENDYLTKSTACQICESSYHGEDLLLCDGCDGLFHRQCLNPPLQSVPDGDWFCPSCASYDSDASSVAELEACGGFVIEQRKRSMAQDRAYSNEKNMRVGFSSDSWSAAVLVVKNNEETRNSPLLTNEQSQRNDNEVIPQRNTQKESNHVQSKKSFVTLYPGELCWAKREAAPIGKLGRNDWWPAMIIQSTDTRLTKKAKLIIHTPYVVKMFALPGAGRVRASAVLPFFPHYEEIGHKRIMFSRGQEGYAEFRRALEESITEIGCKHLGQALKKAREITTSAKGHITSPTRESHNIENIRSTSNSPSLSDRNMESNSHRRPAEWRDAEASEIDGIVILSRRSLNPDLEVSQHDRHKESNEESIYSKSLDPEQTYNQSLTFSPSKVSLPPLENLMGGIVAWVIPKESSTYSSSNVRGNNHTNLQMGVVVDFNAIHEKILVRCLPTLNNVIASIANARIQDVNDDGDDDTSIPMHACSLGPTIWLNIECVTHISDGPSQKSEATCASILSNSLENTRQQIRDRILDEATKREENTVELVSLSSSNNESSIQNEFGLEDQSNHDKNISYGGDKNQDKQSASSNTSSRRSPFGLSLSKSQNMKGAEAAATRSNSGSQRVKSSVGGKTTPSHGGEGIYVAEKILDVRLNSSCKKEFLIQWKGFPKEDCTWEPIENILNQSLHRVFSIEQMVKKMKLTGEAKNTKSLTYRLMKVLEKGLKKIGENKEKIGKDKSRACPFCGYVLRDGSAFGGHVKMHSKEPNYKLVRDAYKTVVEENLTADFHI